MRSTRQQNKRRKIVKIVVIIIIVAMAFAYVLPMTAMAETPPTTPPPEDFGTDTGYDDSTLPPMPGEEPVEEEKPPPVLRILDASIRLDVNQQRQISLTAENIPEGTILEWTSGNPTLVGVDVDGTVVAYAPGSADVVVMAVIDGKNYRSSVLVTVNELKASKLTINFTEDVSQLGPRAYEVTVGEVIHMNVKVEPVGANVDKITWKLGNENVATITPNSQTCTFVADAVGQTQVTVTASNISDAITFNIVENGVAIDTLWTYIRFGIIIVVVIIALVFLLSWLSQKKKKEIARQKAVVKRRKEEAERRAREEAEQENLLGQLPPQTEDRTTQKISGAAVGASVSAPKGEDDEPDRPITFDDLK